MKLGLLYEVGVDTATVADQRTFLSFQQKSLQEFATSKHLAKRLEKSIKEGIVMVGKYRLFSNVLHYSLETISLHYWQLFPFRRR